MPSDESLGITRADARSCPSPPMVHSLVQLGHRSPPGCHAGQVGTVLYLLSSVKIGRDYLFSMDTCPVISKAKSLATRVDAKVFYYYKAGFTGP